MNRVGEVWDCIKNLPSDVEIIWGWVRSEDNGADIASRTDADPENLAEGSVWQDGPAYLRLPDSEWPIDRDIMQETQSLPKEELKKQFKHQTFGQKILPGLSIRLNCIKNKLLADSFEENKEPDPMAGTNQNKEAIHSSREGMDDTPAVGAELE